MNLHNICGWDYKFYQNEWQGINLVEISNDLKIPLEDLAAEDLYNEFYRRLRDNNYKFQKNWLESKKNMSKWLEKFVDETEVKLNRKPKVISIGCGLGVIEEEFISNNYDIELQECQEISFEYLKSKNLEPSKKWITANFADLPSNTYDIIFVNQVVYSFDNGLYESFIKNANRILHNAGYLIIIDSNARFIDKIYSMFRPIKRKLLGGSPALFWGFVRTSNMHKNLALKSKFKIIMELVFDKFCNTTNSAKGRIYGRRLLSSEIATRGYIFQKTDE